MIASFSNITEHGFSYLFIEHGCMDDSFKLNTTVVFCGGLFSKEMKDNTGMYNGIKELIMTKKENKENFIIILSPRDVYIITTIIRYNALLSAMKKKEIEFEDKAMKKLLKKYNVEVDDNIKDNYIACSVMKELEITTLTFSFISFFVQKIDILKYLLQNSCVSYETETNIYTAYSYYSNNKEYSDAVSRFLESKKMNKVLREYFESTDPPFSSTKVVVVGDSTCKSDTPFFDKSSNFITLNTELGRKEGCFFHYNNTMKVESEFKISSKTSAECIGMLIEDGGKYNIFGFNSRDLLYNSELLCTSFSHPSLRINFTQDEFFVTDEMWTAVSKTDKNTRWINKDKNDERILCKTVINDRPPAFENHEYHKEEVNDSDDVISVISVEGYKKEYTIDILSSVVDVKDSDSEDISLSELLEEDGATPGTVRKDHELYHILKGMGLEH